MQLGAAYRVYPRPRGGTRTASGDFSAIFGLSPPTRGNLACERPDVIMNRSIPAHAGEPARRRPLIAAVRVYPRPRGGTGTRRRRGRRPAGLSPPTRGNPAGGVAVRRYGGSIPAHAGEPALSPCRTSDEQVYPRPRGGTQRPRLAAPHRPGLSPPTRGNRRHAEGGRGRRGSIPAHAGEPPAAAVGLG